MLREGRDDDLEIAVAHRETIGSVLHRLGEDRSPGWLRSLAECGPQVEPAVPGIRRQARQCQQGRGHVEQAHRRLEGRGCADHAGLPEDQRNAQELFVERVAVIGASRGLVVPQVLAVVREHHHDRMLQTSAGLEAIEKAADEGVRVGDVSVVEVGDEAPLVLGQDQLPLPDPLEIAVVEPIVDAARLRRIREVVVGVGNVGLVAMQEQEEGRAIERADPVQRPRHVGLGPSGGDLVVALVDLEPLVEARVAVDRGSAREGRGPVAGVPKALCEERPMGSDGRPVPAGSVIERQQRQEERGVGGLGPGRG